MQKPSSSKIQTSHIIPLADNFLPTTTPSSYTRFIGRSSSSPFPTTSPTPQNIPKQTPTNATSGTIVISKYAVGLPLTAFHVISFVATKITEYNTLTKSSGQQQHATAHTNRFSSRGYCARWRKK